jgi:hypothetical protein
LEVALIVVVGVEWNQMSFDGQVGRRIVAFGAGILDERGGLTV